MTGVERAGHEVVEDAVRRGVPAVFDRPKRRRMPAHDNDDAWADRTIDGAWLAELLTTHPELNGRGLAIHHARILGGLRLDDADLPGRLTLVECQLGDSPVSLRDARTRTIVLQAVRCGSIDADRCRIGGGLQMPGTAVRGRVSMVDARVDASVECAGASFGAMDADLVQIGGSLILGAGFTAAGPVMLQNASIGGSLDLSNSRLTNPGDDAVRLDGAHIGGTVAFQRSTVRGRARLVGVEIGGDFNCSGASFEHPDGAALDVTRTTIAGHALLDDGVTATGQVRFTGTGVGGKLRLSGATLSCADGLALHADGVTVGEALLLDEGFSAVGGLRLVGARVGAAFDCTGAHLEAGTDGGPALNLIGAEIGGSLLLSDGFTATGAVQFSGASISGWVECNGGSFLNPGDIALRGSGARIASGLVLHDGFRAEGQVRFPGATIGRDLHAGRRCTIVNPGATALHAPRLRVIGNVVLGEGFSADGGVLLERAVVEGNLDLSGGTFSHHGAPAFDMSAAQVGGAVFCNGDTTMTGRLRISDAAVAGDVNLGAVRITNEDDYAISATNTRVTANVYIRGHVVGGIRLRGITIGADLDCRNAHLEGADDRPALSADRSTIGGGFFFNSGFRAEGEVRLRSALINGHASCRNGTFVNPGGMALNLAGSRFVVDLLLDQGYAASGATWLAGATIGSDLSCSGGTFRHPGGDALRLAGAHVHGRVNLDEGFSAEGEVTLTASMIGGDLRCDGGHFGGGALDATGAGIAGTLSLRDGFHCDGPVVLRGTTAGTLHDDSASWPASVDLDGFRYERLTCPAADRSWRARSRWLLRQRTPSALGYVQLAAVYRASGDELWARRILIQRYNALLRPPDHWRPQLPTGPLYQAWKAWRWVLRLTIGHGFAPSRSLLIALPLAVSLAAWLSHARAEDMLVPTDDTVAAAGNPPEASSCDDTYPCLQPAVYALDNLVPIVDLGQRSRWAPDQSHRGATWLDDGRWLAAAAWATSVLGWVLATLVAASFTQAVRRE